MQQRPSPLEVVAVALAAIAAFIDMYATQPVLPLLSHEFHVDAPTAGLTISVVVGAVALASAFLGPLSDAVGRKTVMVISGAMLTLATVACALVPSFGELVAARMLQGVMIAGISAVAIAYIGDRFPRERIPGLVGAYVACTAIGGLSGRVITGILADRLTWRAPFAVYAFITLVATVLMIFALRQPKSHGDRIRLSAILPSMSAHLKHRRLLGMFVLGMLVMFGFTGVFTYLPYRLNAAPFYLSTAAISAFFLSYIAGVITSPIAGRFAHGRDPRALMTAGAAIAMVGCLLTLVASLPLIAVATVLLCIGLFIVQAIAPGHVNTTAQEAKGAAASLYQLFYYGGAMAGSVVPGIAYKFWAWDGTIGACVVSIALAVVVMWTIGRNRNRVSVDRAA